MMNRELPRDLVAASIGLAELERAAKHLAANLEDLFEATPLAIELASRLRQDRWIEEHEFRDFTAEGTQDPQAIDAALDALASTIPQNFFPHTVSRYYQETGVEFDFGTRRRRADPDRLRAWWTDVVLAWALTEERVPLSAGGSPASKEHVLLRLASPRPSNIPEHIAEYHLTEFAQRLQVLTTTDFDFAIALTSAIDAPSTFVFDLQVIMTKPPEPTYDPPQIIDVFAISRSLAGEVGRTLHLGDLDGSEVALSQMAAFIDVEEKSRASLALAGPQLDISVNTQGAFGFEDFTLASEVLGRVTNFGGISRVGPRPGTFHVERSPQDSDKIRVTLPSAVSDFHAAGGTLPEVAEDIALLIDSAHPDNLMIGDRTAEAFNEGATMTEIAADLRRLPVTPEIRAGLKRALEPIFQQAQLLIESGTFDDDQGALERIEAAMNGLRVQLWPLDGQELANPTRAIDLASELLGYQSTIPEGTTPNNGNLAGPLLTTLSRFDGSDHDVDLAIDLAEQTATLVDWKTEPDWLVDDRAFADYVDRFSHQDPARLLQIQVAAQNRFGDAQPAAEALRLEMRRRWIRHSVWAHNRSSEALARVLQWIPNQLQSPAEQMAQVIPVTGGAGAIGRTLAGQKGGHFGLVVGLVVAVLRMFAPDNDATKSP